jgi:hypothetical protein
MRFVRPAPAGVLLLGVLAALLVDAAPAKGHELGVVRVRLVEDGPGRYILDVKLPLVPEFETRFPTLPERCRMPSAPNVQRRREGIAMRLIFDCAGSPLTTADVLQLPWPNHGAFVSTELRSGATAGHFFEASEQGAAVALETLIKEDRIWSDISGRYVLLGIEHILTGWDHLAFVLTLCLIASGWHLLRLVSAFTLGHSLTLALAALGVVHVPTAPTEACIALSIVLVAREAVRGGEATARHGMTLVFGFGLMHGLGFASALAASGIQRGEFFLGLFTFNLGVEFGQLIFVMVVLTLSLIGRPLGTRPRRAAAAATAYTVGILGAFWMLQRTFLVLHRIPV